MSALPATGFPLTDELKLLFAQWGNLTGIRVVDGAIEAQFNAVTVRFIVGSVVVG